MQDHYSGYALEEIASVLRLNRGRLEKRVKAVARTQERSRASLSTAGQGFIEVGALGDGYPEECTVESEDGEGRKFTMHLKGAGCRQAIEIAKAFWSLGR